MSFYFLYSKYETEGNKIHISFKEHFVTYPRLFSKVEVGLK